MSELISIRASSAGLRVACPGSFTLPSQSRDSEEANLGTANHDAFAQYVNYINGRPGAQRPDLEVIGRRHGVEKDDLRSVFAGFVKILEDEGQFFPDPYTEVALEMLTPTPAGRPFKLTGHVDFLSAPGDGTMRLADLKSGWLEGNHVPQLKTYALLAMETYIAPGQIIPDDIEKVYASIFWPRNRAVDGYWFMRDELLDWQLQLGTAIDRSGEGRFHLGEHCKYCSAIGCQAQKNAILQVIPSDSLATLTAENAHEYFNLISHGKKRFDQAYEALKQFCFAEGPFPAPDGRELHFTPRETRTVKLNQKAAQFLLETFTPEELFDLCKISKGALEKAAGDKAGPGQKGTAAKKLIDDLEELGAIDVSVSQILGIGKPETIS